MLAAQGENMQKESANGYKIVLTTDRTLMSEYNGLIFLGFSACIPKGLIPDRLYFSVFCPSVGANKNGAAKYAPCGSRKIEAALLNNGFKREDVIVAHSEHLSKVIGPDTKVLAITETDPLGKGPATSTFTQLFGREAYMSLKFKELLSHPAVQLYKPKIIVGGPGAWQLEEAEARERLGVDCVVIGEGEKTAVTIIEKVLKGEPLPQVVHGEVVAEEQIPCIREPTVAGIIEIARGCGRGCDFCVPTLQNYRCLPIEHILQEVEVNLRAGRSPLLHAEDVLRYKANGLTVNKEAVIELFNKVKSYPGVKTVAFSHFALSSVASAPDVVKTISDILGIDGENGNWLSGQTGIETGSPMLIKAHMLGKCRPFEPEDWPQVVVDAFQVLSENFWVPVATLIIGLPGETERDIDLTIDLVEQLNAFKSLLVPLFFVSEGGLKNSAESFSIEHITPKQCELFLNCWSHNLDWSKSLIADYLLNGNQVKATVMKFVFSYGIETARKLIRTCERDYDYDLPAMMQDVKEGKLRAAPLPIRLASKLAPS